VLARAVLRPAVAAGVYLTLALRLPFGGRVRARFYPVIVAVFALVVALAATASAFRGAPGAAELSSWTPPPAARADLGGGTGGVLSRAALGRLSGGGVCVRCRRPRYLGAADDRAARGRADLCGLVRTLRRALDARPARALVS
jgi:hypothetical protein